MGKGRFPVTERSRTRRHPERASHDREEVYRILDEGLVCHVGLVADGRPVVIPMAYGRDGDRLILHGAKSSRLMSALALGCEACVTVTLLDGVVLARSTFHSSMNYRAVVAFGRARRITGAGRRRAALDRLADHLVPGRSQEARKPNASELAATEVVEFLIEEASARMRSGPPKEPVEDTGLAVWAGVLPLRLTAQRPEPAPDLPPGTEPSDSVRRFHAARGLARQRRSR